MKAKYGKYASNMAFLDMLFNLVIAFAFLFLASFMLIKPPAEDHPGGMKLSAEFVITMTWPDDSIDDIDMWMLLPDGKMISFLSKDSGYVTLDRDDRGALGDILEMPDGTRKLTEINKEIMTIRAIRPGKYTVNAFAYAQYKHMDGFDAKTTFPMPVKMTLTKLNPTTKELISTEFILETVGQQHTGFTFELGADGNVYNIEKDDDVPFVDTPPQGGGSH